MSGIAKLEAIAPEFTDDPRAETFLEIAASLHTASAWGTAVYETAMAYFAAHLLTVADQAVAGAAGASGPVTSRSAGDLSETYANAQGSSSAWDALLSTTSYGRMYLYLRGTRAAAAPQLIQAYPR